MNACAEIGAELYESRVDRIYERLLRPRMVAALNHARDDFLASGYEVTEPYDLSGDDYHWAITVSGNGLPEDVDVSIEIAESAAYEGTTAGVNVGLSLVTYEGQIVGELTPYNFTPEVWVDVRDARAILARMDIITNGCHTVCEYLDEWLGREAL